MLLKIKIWLSTTSCKVAKLKTVTIDQRNQTLNRALPSEGYNAYVVQRQLKLKPKRKSF